MPSLHPLMSAQPQCRLPGEAPQFFSPFFERASKPPPETAWQPPNTECVPRSKVPTYRPHAPSIIPSMNTWSRKRRSNDNEEVKGLFKPRSKKMDEVVWLGSVGGFEPPELENPLRSKLVRKPEMMPSQASAAVGPKATEAQKKKEEEQKAREKRLEEWSQKKSANASQGLRMLNRADRPTFELPQPVESRIYARPKLYTPVTHEEVARISNRPNAIHRPHMPAHKDASYAPEKTVLPQPIGTARKNLPPLQPKKAVDHDETIWMGLPQPIETTRKSNRRSRPAMPAQLDDEKSPASSLQATVGAGSANRLNDVTSALPQPIETSKKPHRGASEKQHQVPPEPVETARRLHRSSLKGALLQPIESNRSTQTPVSDAGLITPDDTVSPETATKNPGQPDASGKGDESPTAPTASLFNFSQPIETTLRSRRPLARPLIPVPVETSRRSNRSRIPPTELHLELPRSIPVTKWPNRSSRLCGDHQESTPNRPMSPGLYAPPLHGNGGRRKSPAYSAPSVDHIWHLHEPIDSSPPTPFESPDGSPGVSQCPSLSSSPASTTSTLWDGAARPNRRLGIQCDEGFAGYVLGLERDLKKQGALGSRGRLRERAREEDEHPFPKPPDDSSAKSCQGLWQRAKTSGTAHPPPLATVTEHAIKPCKPTETKHADGHPICGSPPHENFKRLHATVAPEPRNQSDKRAQPLRGGAQLPATPDLIQNSLSVRDAKNAADTRLSNAPQLKHCDSSPGYTVASLPPAKCERKNTNEVTKDFVDDVYRYLSLQYENIAWKFDEELVEYTGLPIERVREDRWEAIKKYCEQFVSEHPKFLTGEQSKMGLW